MPPQPTLPPDRAFAGGGALRDVALAAVLAAAAVASASDVTPAQTPTPDGSSGAARLEQLKRDYLECERLAHRAVLDGSSGMACSVVYERLKAEGFGGDFAALNRWWQAQRPRVHDEPR